MENLGTHELRTMVTEAADEAVNIGYRVGDTLHRWRERRAIAQGQEPIIVPSEGYGRVATGAKNGWVRILARALYKTEAFEKLKIRTTPCAGGVPSHPLPCLMLP